MGIANLKKSLWSRSVYHELFGSQVSLANMVCMHVCMYVCIYVYRTIPSKCPPPTFCLVMVSAHPRFFRFCLSAHYHFSRSRHGYMPVSLPPIPAFFDSVLSAHHHFSRSRRGYIPVSLPLLRAIVQKYWQWSGRGGCQKLEHTGTL